MAYFFDPPDQLGHRRLRAGQIEAFDRRIDDLIQLWIQAGSAFRKAASLIQKRGRDGILSVSCDKFEDPRPAQAEFGAGAQEGRTGEGWHRDERTNYRLAIASDAPCAGIGARQGSACIGHHLAHESAGDSLSAVQCYSIKECFRQRESAVI